VVSRQDDVEARLLQAEAESSCTTKEISGQPGFWVAPPDLPRKL
jgi:hypothetical protein